MVHQLLVRHQLDSGTENAIAAPTARERVGSSPVVPSAAMGPRSPRILTQSGNSESRKAHQPVSPACGFAEVLIPPILMGETRPTSKEIVGQANGPYSDDSNKKKGDGSRWFDRGTRQPGSARVSDAPVGVVDGGVVDRKTACEDDAGRPNPAIGDANSAQGHFQGTGVR